MLPSPLPDDPRKWDGWNLYNSENFYERLCLTFESSPTNEQIEDHSRQLQIWWQKKLPLKNQPSNPLAQLLRGGMDIAPRYLAEARAELLNPERRAAVDAALRNRIRAGALAEFQKFLDFALSDHVLTLEEESNLLKLANALGLSGEDVAHAIEAGLRATGAKREADLPPPEPPPQPAPAAPPPQAPADEVEPAPDGAKTSPRITTRSFDSPTRTRRVRASTPADEFRRMLGLSGLDSESMSDDRRDTFIDMAENMGLDPAAAEDMVDEYLEGIEEGTIPLSPRGGADAPPTPPPPRNGAGKPGVAAVAPATPNVTFKKVAKPEGVRLSPGSAVKSGTVVSTAARPAVEILDPAEERRRYPNFLNSLGTTMLFIPSATFTMGNPPPARPPTSNRRPASRSAGITSPASRSRTRSTSSSTFPTRPGAARGRTANIR